MLKLPVRTLPMLFLLGLVTAGFARAQDGIAALSPHPSERLSQSPALIAVNVPGATHGTLNKGAVRLVVDGHDVSDLISISGTRIEYKPSPALVPGEHAVEVSVVDSGGGKLSYSWTFTVAGAAQNATAAAVMRGGATAPSDSLGAGAGAGILNGGADFGSADSGDQGYDQSQPPQQIYAQQNYYAGYSGGYGGFYPSGYGPYYWGDNAMYTFTGVPGGYGFLTFSGIPGVFDLMPLGLNMFYAIIPIPIGYAFGSPSVTCHFFPPWGGGSTVVSMPSFPITRNRRPPVHTPVVGRVTSFPISRTGTTLHAGGTHFALMHSGAAPAQHTGYRPGTFRSAPHLGAPRMTAPHMMAPVQTMPHFVSAPHMSAPVMTAPHMSAPVMSVHPIGRIK
jgi:hypothetical protein